MPATKKCPQCGVLSMRSGACLSCGLAVREETKHLGDGRVLIDVELNLGRGRRRYRAKVDLELARSSSIEDRDEAASVEYSEVLKPSTWITSNAETTRRALSELAVRIVDGGR